ncbi:hypothetical protein AB0G04_30920 [Actinoplanes sp. NPDC023801]|uniref:hypothetical protein n=1 Tax=Actinoplanes sp. NPDC023801 TaxID=3154595 RepID=UPI0033EA6D56
MEGEADTGTEGGGAVGVGTGGVSQSHSGERVTGTVAGLLVRPVTGPAAVAAGSVVTAVAGAGARTAAGGVVPRGLRGAAGTPPIPALPPVPVPVPASVPAAGGSAAATAGAGVSVIRPAKAVVATRYDPAAPHAASAQNALIATSRRGGRASVSGGWAGRSTSDPGNVFIPVEVTSGPAPEPGHGRCPRS